MPTIGYQWLAKAHDIDPVHPFAVQSTIGSSRTTLLENDLRREVYPESYRPAETLKDQLTFALKHEEVHLEFLSRLFQRPAIKEALTAWVHAEPTGAYARRAGFLYEWLTGGQLDFAGVARGNYVDALDDKRYLTGAPINNPRWRVRDNLPGNRDFCPIVRRTDAIRQAEAYDIAAKLVELEDDYGVDLILRSTVWLTVKESRASFQIEREQGKEDRIRRFAAVMERECGRHDDPFAPGALTSLQRGILGESALRYGLRRSPVFVGHTSHYQPVVDYIAPHWDDTVPMLGGLSAFMSRTQGQASLLRAAVASFGFVYVHPMADGNGRISRFLINDVLRRDGQVPAPIILPVSATITHSTRNRADYDRVLERFSRPLLQRYNQHYRFAESIEAEDGVIFNFHFDAYEGARPAWAYPDLTAHVAYLAQVIDQTLSLEMRDEARFLQANERARQAIKQVLEAPDNDLDVIIRSVRENGNRISNKLIKRYPLLEQNPALAEHIVVAVIEAFSHALASGHTEKN
ncbi:Fic family protein [Craterilacuibacter sp. RT1T]|uniref:Fic family protein n=1 Tax=Craterilacuibacter sp. RT1T TaxID=2942211 RepID=UPI0020BD5458|nr:Fic family protein [Craterilacuibacter sp. RT1T]MCL6262067.1 Fic family protein [Craterilacuibacter sp. RT1T]